MHRDCDYSQRLQPAQPAKQGYDLLPSKALIDWQRLCLSSQEWRLCSIEL